MFNDGGVPNRMRYLRLSFLSLRFTVWSQPDELRGEEDRPGLLSQNPLFLTHREPTGESQTDSQAGPLRRGRRQ